MSEQTDNSKAVWFLAGAAIGATLALLFAPQSGAETRRMIGKKAEEGRDALTERGRDLVEKGRGLYEKGGRIAEEAAELFDRGKRIVQG
jgi:gas vesicle protein